MYVSKEKGMYKITVSFADKKKEILILLEKHIDCVLVMETRC